MMSIICKRVKIKLIKIISIIIISLFMFEYLEKVVFASSISDDDYSCNFFDEIMNEIVKDESIIGCDYLLNFDGRPDYIYVEFKRGGYAIFYKDTMELLEYCLNFSLPLFDYSLPLYYAGPYNYYYKSDSNEFINIITENKIETSESMLIEYSSKIRERINRAEAKKYDVDISDFQKKENIIQLRNNFEPEINTKYLISGNTASGQLISNYNYFLANPTIGSNYEGETYGNNNSGTCASVAAQLLLSYNNYYNDRRIIDDRFLNGYDDFTNSVVDLEKNPNYCNNPNLMNEYTTGTRSEATGINSFYCEIISRIMSPNTSGATINQAGNGIDRYLSDHLLSSGYTLNYHENGWFFGINPISSSIIKGEIDADRPIIISMGNDLGGSNHDVVGYGYQDYTYPDGGGTYEGYVVHYGWKRSGANCVWINSSWCDGYISLQINHTHSFVPTSNIFNNEDIELCCSTCNYRTTADIYTCFGSIITGFNYPISGNITIPNSINGITITSISSNAFYGCTSLESVTIPSTITNIGSYAFYGCTSLDDVNILRDDTPITSLGLNAFSSCSSDLTITVPANRVCEYKNVPFWSSYKDNIIPSSSIEQIDLDCMSDENKLLSLNPGKNKLFQLNVGCCAWYKITSSSGTHFNIYNSNMVKIEGDKNNYELTLNASTYYIDVEWIGIENYGYVILSFFSKGISVTRGNNDILTHLHEVGTYDYRVRLVYYNNSGSSFYHMSLNIDSDSIVDLDYGAITVYTTEVRNAVMNKYSHNNILIPAQTIESANDMVIYLEDNEYYYIDVILDTDDLNILLFKIDFLQNENVDLFNLDEDDNDSCSLLSDNLMGDCFRKINLKQTGRFEISALYSNTCSSSTYVLLLRIINNNNVNSFDVLFEGNVSNNPLISQNYVDLDSGIYYVGYYNKNNTVLLTINYNRLITQSGSSHLVADTYDYDDYGSEVRFNNGLRGGTSLTVGFTRFIYLDNPLNVPSISRLNYYWYTSNEEVATISEYGTLLAKSPGTVKVMAVYKNNPSIAYVREFTILADNRVGNLTIYDTDTTTYTGPNQLYQVELDDYNSYFPQISLYNWSLISSTNNFNYTISEWGTFYLSGNDVIVIEATSKLNSKLKIRITVTIE